MHLVNVPSLQRRLCVSFLHFAAILLRLRVYKKDKRGINLLSASSAELEFPTAIPVGAIRIAVSELPGSNLQMSTVPYLLLQSAEVELGGGVVVESEPPNLDHGELLPVSAAWPLNP